MSRRDRRLWGPVAPVPVCANGIPPVIADAREGDWILTYSGATYWPLDPRPEEVHIKDIAHALSLEPRYGGHTYEPYSVAQHSVLVTLHCGREHQLAALLHDATEAYLKDVPRPVKKHIMGYEAIERKNAVAIGKAFGVDLVDLPAQVKEQDNRALFTEKRDLRPPEPRIDHAAPPGLEPWPDRITPWSWQEAEANFLRMFAALRR